MCWLPPLIVADIQNEYYAGQDFRGRMVIPDGAEVLLKSKTLVDYAHQKGMPLFAENSVFAQFHKDLQPTGQDIIITRETPSSFVGTDLDARLKQQGIKKLIVAGLRGRESLHEPPELYPSLSANDGGKVFALAFESAHSRCPALSRKTDRPVEDIAERVGFPSITSLRRHF